MDIFFERAQRARSIVESSGGVVLDRNAWLMCVQVPQDRVWQLSPLRLSYVGRTGERMLYDVDLRPAPLRAVAGGLASQITEHQLQPLRTHDCGDRQS